MWSKEQYEAKEAERTRKRQETGKKPWHWLGQPDPVARFTAYLAVFTFCLLLVSIFQWLEIHSGSADTKTLAEAARDQATAVKEQLEVMRIQADAVKKQAEAAVESASTAHQTMLSAQRAWIGPVDARLEGELKQSEELKVVVAYQNSGKEPGYNFVYDMKYIAYTKSDDNNGIASEQLGLDAAACMQREGPRESQVVFPSTGFASYEVRLNIDKSNIDDALVNGENTLFIHGCLAYKSFGEFRHTAFCYFFNAKTSNKAHLNICPVGHRAD